MFYKEGLNDMAKATIDLSRYLGLSIDDIWEKHTDEKIKQDYTLDEIKQYLRNNCDDFVNNPKKTLTRIIA